MWSYLARLKCLYLLEVFLLFLCMAEACWENIFLKKYLQKDKYIKLLKLRAWALGTKVLACLQNYQGFSMCHFMSWSVWKTSLSLIK